MARCIVVTAENSGKTGVGFKRGYSLAYGIGVQQHVGISEENDLTPGFIHTLVPGHGRSALLFHALQVRTVAPDRDGLI